MRKVLKRITAFLIATATAVTMFGSTASALTVGNKYSFSTTYKQVYYDWGTYITADGVYHSASGQLALRKLTSTVEPLYCLEPN